MSLLRFISVLVMFCSFYSAVHAQIRIVPREMLDAAANPRHSSDSAWLSFDHRKIVADPMNEDDVPKPFRYLMVNEGPAPVQIKRMMTTCSCATAVCDRKVVQPGDTAVITVTYNPKGHPGKFERRVFVYTQEGNSPAAILSLVVQVDNSKDLSGLYPAQIGPIRLRRGSVSFTEGKLGVERIPFVNLSGKPLHLECDKALMPQCLEFKTEPSVVEDGKEGNILISYSPDRGVSQKKMMVFLKGMGVAPSRASILVELK